jgi:multiple antibiotic resistance protein
MLPLREYSRFVISLLAALGPIAALPIFLAHTRRFSQKETSRTAIVAASTAALVLVAAALIGPSLLRMLGTSLGSLQIAGGLVMLLMGLSGLNSRDGPGPSDHAQDPAIGVVPLGFPVLAGPGSISSVIVAIGHGSGVAHGAMIVTCVLAVCATAWVVLRAAHPIRGYLGRRGISALSRFFAFLLAAIAVEIISAGLRSLFPALG